MPLIDSIVLAQAAGAGGSVTRCCEWLALALSLLALVGSLYMSMGLKLRACPLCFYQRTFMMGLVGVLGMALVGWPPEAEPGLVSLLCLPLAVGGLGVAAFHVYLERAGILECPAGLFGWGTAPQQSLGAFVLVALSLAAAVVASSPAALAWGGVGPEQARQLGGRIIYSPLAQSLAAVVLGLLFAWLAIKSAPPLPAPTPPAPDGSKPPLIECRPIWHGPPPASPEQA